MAVADFLEKVGKGLETGAKVAGAVAAPVGSAIVNEEAGYAPQIAAEQRRRQQKLEDEQIAAKEQELTAQLETGRKYGTLTPEQQGQYVDAITQLYSHPRHAGTLMEKLRQAVHPNGAVATRSSLSTLKNAVPEGGTAAADEENRERALTDALGMRQAATDEEIDRRSQDAAKYHKPAGKSPPTPGNQLPPDAIGPDGNPISASDRNAGKSFMEWNGAWYAAPKAKPVYKTIKGHLVLMDPATNLPQRDLGPVAGVKLSTHQTPFLGDDGQMHLLTTTSVTTPQGETIDVEAPQPETGNAPTGEGGESKPPAPAKPKGVGGILPKTGAKPVTAPPGGVAGPVIQGSRAWASTKDPMFRADVSSYKKANDDVIAATKLSSLADQVAEHPDDAVNQKRLAVALERQASGRFTTQALGYVMKAGWGNSIEEWAKSPTTGALPHDIMRQLVDGAHQNLKSAQDALKVATPRQLSGTGGDSAGGGWQAPADAPPAPSQDGKVLKSNGQVIAKSQGGKWVQP
jgi:hypothetical protein